MASLSNLLFFLPAKSPNPTKTPSFSPPYAAASSLSWSKPCFPLSITRNGYLPHDLSSVIWPSLTYSNTLFFSSPHSKRHSNRKDEELELPILKTRKYNVEYVVKENEAEESLVRGFRSKVLKAGILQECKRRRFFENKQEKKKRKARDSAKKNRSRRRPPRAKQSHKKEKSRKKDEDEDEDNWELPEGELPY